MARLLIALALGLMLLAPKSAHAHRGSTKYVEAELVSDGARVSVAIDATDAAQELGLPPDAAPAALAGRADLLRTWLSRGVSVTTTGGRCTARVGEPKLGARVSVDVAYACAGDIQSAVLRDDTVFDLDPLHETVLTIVRDGSRSSEVLNQTRREALLGKPVTSAQTALAFAREGVHHLVTGYDHLLFLLALLLGAGPVARSRGRCAALRQIAAIVTAFTLGHSLTLAAAALGLVALPGALVETAIAASIVLACALNVSRPSSALERPAIALGFGLVHGFGFSSVLADAGLPAGGHVLALVSFNVGIEIAQLALVVLAVFPLAWLSARAAYERVVLQAGSAAIGALACVWMVERALGA